MALPLFAPCLLRPPPPPPSSSSFVPHFFVSLSTLPHPVVLLTDFLPSFSLVLQLLPLPPFSTALFSRKEEKRMERQLNLEGGRGGEEGREISSFSIKQGRGGEMRIKKEEKKD